MDARLALFRQQKKKKYATNKNERREFASRSPAVTEQLTFKTATIDDEKVADFAV